MGTPADGSRWWLDRSARTAAAAVLGLALIAWVVLLTRPTMSMPGMGAGTMSGMSGTMPATRSMVPVAVPPVADWSDGAIFVAAWGVMMAAMMLPSATPMIALFNTVSRARDPGASGVGRTVAFAAPYAIAWIVSGVPVYLGAALVATLDRDHAWARTAAPYGVAAVLLAAGLYQFTGAKHICLAKCRNPLGFIALRWRNGWQGAVRLGTEHAAYCIGCCGLLMTVLVVAGSMGIGWVLLIAAVVFAEKLLPARLAAPTVTGVLLVILGVLVAFDPSAWTPLPG